MFIQPPKIFTAFGIWNWGVIAFISGVFLLVRAGCVDWIDQCEPDICYLHRAGFLATDAGIPFVQDVPAQLLLLHQSNGTLGMSSYCVVDTIEAEA